MRDMDPLSQLRGLIASLDEVLVDSLCARARLHRNEKLYALPDGPAPELNALARPFAGVTTLAGRIHLLRPAYLRILLPALCEDGNEDERSACLAADANCLDALARRLALSVHVATRKREAIPEALQIAIQTGEPARVEQAITNAAVEAEVLARVQSRAVEHAPRKETPDQIANLYIEWIIPLSRKIQVFGLLATP